MHVAFHQIASLRQKLVYVEGQVRWSRPVICSLRLSIYPPGNISKTSKYKAFHLHPLHLSVLNKQTYLTPSGESKSHPMAMLQDSGQGLRLILPYQLITILASLQE